MQKEITNAMKNDMQKEERSERIRETQQIYKTTKWHKPVRLILQ